MIPRTITLFLRFFLLLECFADTWPALAQELVKDVDVKAISKASITSKKSLEIFTEETAGKLERQFGRQAIVHQLVEQVQIEEVSTYDIYMARLIGRSLQPEFSIETTKRLDVETDPYIKRRLMLMFRLQDPGMVRKVIEPHLADQRISQHLTHNERFEGGYPKRVCDVAYNTIVEARDGSNAGQLGTTDPLADRDVAIAKLLQNLAASAPMPAKMDPVAVPPHAIESKNDVPSNGLMEKTGDSDNRGDMDHRHHYFLWIIPVLILVAAMWWRNKHLRTRS